MATTQRLVVIITALPVERAAVLEHLRDVCEEPELRGSIYRRGIFDERSDPWDVIVAEIGAGNEGAAAEAERVIAHYSPQVALFVGVAGAIKDLTHGDVVASTKVYAYESGKDQPGGLRPRPYVQLPTYALEQRTRYEAGEPDWRQRIKGVGSAGQGATPAAKVGPIAAGEKVLASNRSQIFKFIRANYGDAVAVEMEGHGFLHGVHMNHPTQGMVIRSISDCLSDKNEANDESWQPVAARHAAAFAFQVLAKLPPAEGSPSRGIVAVAPAQQVNIGDVSGDNNTLTINQHQGPMAEDHVRSVEHVIELLKLSMAIDALSVGPVNPTFGATGCFYIAVRNGPVPLWPTLKMADFSDGALNETPFIAHWRGPVSPHFLSVGEPQQFGLLGIATLPSQNPVLFIWAQGGTRMPVTRDLPLERQEPVEFVVTFYGKYTVVARRTGELNHEEEKVLAKRKYRVAPDTSHQAQFKYKVVSEEVLPV
jgi:nucleoside phosphorylase